MDESGGTDVYEWTLYMDPQYNITRLYLNNQGINENQMWRPKVDIPKANARWIKAFGKLHAGPFNTGGCNISNGVGVCDCMWPRAFTCTTPTHCTVTPDDARNVALAK